MKAIRRFRSLEKSDKIIFFLRITVVLNVIMAAVKFVFSLTLPSLWFFVNAIFGIILSLARLFSIRDYKKVKSQKDIDVKITIPARGLPAGADPGYADSATIAMALKARQLI